MARAVITSLRGTRMAGVLPFDNNVHVHKLLAWVVVACTIIHAVGQGINYYLYYKLTPVRTHLTAVLHYHHHGNISVTHLLPSPLLYRVCLA